MVYNNNADLVNFVSRIANWPRHENVNRVLAEITLVATLFAIDECMSALELMDCLREYYKIDDEKHKSYYRYNIMIERFNKVASEHNIPIFN